MAPNISAPTGVLMETDEEVPMVPHIPEVKKSQDRKLHLVWRNIILFAYLHIASVYGFILMFTSARIYTTLWGFLLYQLGGLGITAGAHRLWAHRSYKAKTPLKILLTFLNTLAFQDAVVDWARDHRVHHKYSETDADPHNATRGFFFAHVGWLLCRKHPDVREKGKGVDLSDLYNDPVLKFQKKFYLLLMPIICFIIPTMIPMYLWDETFSNSFCINLFRYTFTLNATWLVNSAAHIFGHKPYDRFISPSENVSVAVLAMGEGWHNYHHTFPWDYKTSELGKYSTNFTTAFIDFMARIGWAYELKSVPEELIKKRVLRTGDGTHELWGWGDSDQQKEEIDEALITHQKTH